MRLLQQQPKRLIADHRNRSAEAMRNETDAFREMTVDYVEWYVDDIERVLTWLVDGYGFTVRATSAPNSAPTRSVNVGQGGIELLLTESSDEEHPARIYAQRHGDGIADIGIRVPDAAAAFAEAVRRGARPLTAPVTRGSVTTATIDAFGDVTHTFVQRPDDAVVADVRGLTPVPDDGGDGASATGLRRLDHLAVCVEPGRLDSTAEHYQRVLGFDVTLTERIVTGNQAMLIKVVQSASRAVTLTLVEADAHLGSGQIDEFLKNHDGAGVQHMAFSTTDILETVDRLRDRGVQLLSTPAAYYTALANRVHPKRHPVEQLRDLNILVDEDHDGQLYQIFARSVHPRRTIFLEIIERAGATTFGSSNIKHLYNSVEAQRVRFAD
ncbi:MULTISPECIES: 4-hydroxyphenylpyruvate dioxygenase [unclassified Micromonospora]|uniref:4-hydroxyphenylpyruvate dioxygenase n=1 Tax=unclassified Micromonospora TaxID=2617518 RepID=UPI00363D2F1A